MRKAFIVLMISVLCISANAQNRSVNFEQGTFAEALAKAKASNKLIFMDGYASWCGPCKYMANKVFTQDAVADFFNANFINVKFDMEKGEGVALAKRYEIRAYPSFLILDSTGSVQHKIVGSYDADQFIANAKLGMNPETSLTGQMAKYKAGNREPEFVKSYLNTLQTAYMEAEASAIADQYLNTLKENQKVSKATWSIYNDFVIDPFSKNFIFILTNRMKFTDAVGDSALNSKISSVFFNRSFMYLVNRRGTVYSREEVGKLRNLIQSSGCLDADKFVVVLDMADAKALKNGTMITYQTQSFFEKYAPSDEEGYYILSQVVPVALEHGGTNEWTILSKIVDSRLASLKEEQARPSFERLKEKLDEKMKK